MAQHRDAGAKAKRRIRWGARLAGTRPSSPGCALACGLVVLCAACEPADGPDASPGDPDALSEPVVRDSAGIRIIENPEQAPDPTGWRVDTVPSLVIGDDETRGDEYLFATISDAVRLPDGRLVVADGQLHAVRLFDPSGNFVRQLGRMGTGPGEYRRPWRLFLLGSDTIVVRSVYDGEPAPYFTAEGEFIRQWASPVDRAPRTQGPYGFFADGSLLGHVRSPRSRVEEVAEPLEPILVEDIARLVRMGADGDSLSDFGDQVTRRYIVYYELDRAPFGGAASDIMIPYTFRDGLSELYLPQPVTALHGMELYRSEGDRFEILIYDAEARLRRIIRKPHSSTPIRAWADSARSDLMERLSPEFGDRMRRADPPPIPEDAPALDRLLVDDLGNLWVRSNPYGRPEPPTWFVFDTTGALTNSLSMELDPRQIGADFVLATRRGEFGVPHVALFPLRKD